MSFRTEGLNIFITRGDSGATTVTIKNKNGTPYVPQEGDVVRFALKHAKMKPGDTDYADAKPIITKIIPNDTQRLEFAPQDTKGLPFGLYAYDIELTRVDGWVDTFIDAERDHTEFHVTKEVF